MEALKPEDLKVGMKVMITRNTSTGDRSYVGDVLTIKTIDLPYIIIERKAYFKAGMSKDTLLVSEHCFVLPSEEFIRAMEVKDAE